MKNTGSCYNRWSAAPIMIFSITALFASICFIFNLPLAMYALYPAIAATFIFGIIYDKRISVSSVVCVILTLISAVFVSRIFDISYDGMYFHKRAVYNLAKGWNPLYTPLADSDPLARIQELPLWLENYPKGVWSMYACVYKLFGSIEAAKGINIIFILMLFFTAADTIKSVFNIKGLACILLSLVFALNPVITSQYLTFMNDLPVAAVIMVCAFLGMKIYSDKAETLDYINLFLIFAASFTIKFTAPVLCGFTLLAYGVAYAIRKRNRDIVKPIVVVIAAACAGVFILGFDPYVKHMAAGLHPFHPVMGSEKCDIMNTNLPAGFDELSNPHQLLVSLFSCSSPNPGDVPVLKIPFSIHNDELWALGAPDTRLGGFGLFFSGILLISLALWIIALVKTKRLTPAAPAAIIFMLLGMFFPESWWARYNPYVYYLPCIAVLVFAGLPKTRIITYAMCLLMLVNTGISAVCVYGNFTRQTAALTQKLEEIKNSDGNVTLVINDFPSHAIWFDEFGIDYVLDSQQDNIEYSDFMRTTRYTIN